MVRSAYKTVNKMLKLRTRLRLSQDVSLPTFPRFVSLKPQHQTALVQLTAGNRLYSDYNFISLWSWDHQNKLKISTLNSNLVIRFQDYTHLGHYFYSFFGSSKVDETAKTLLTHSASEGILELKLIPQFVIETIQKPSDFIISEDRDSFDYIMAISDLADLASEKNAQKRHNLNKFHREYGRRVTVRELDITSKNVSKQIMKLAKLWGHQNNDEHEYKKNERRAITKVVRNASRVDASNFHVIGLYIDSDLKAFSINEIVGEGFAMGHYKKTDRMYKNLGVALDHYTAKSLQAKGVSHLNHEQDLGIEGLRKAKMASHPVYFLKKYKLSLARTDSI